MSDPPSSFTCVPEIRPSAHVRTVDDLPAIVAAAVAGDDAAWTALVRRFDARLRRAARSFRLGDADVDDVVQATWLQALRTLASLRDRAAAGAWLETTVRRESLRRLQLGTREVLGDVDRADSPDDAPSGEERLIADEQRLALREAIAELPERQRALLAALAAEQCGDYRALAERLAMPVGSIGPIRARALERLRRDAQLRAWAP